MDWIEGLLLSAMSIVLITTILVMVPLIFAIGNISINYFSTNDFCITNGFKGVGGGAIFEPLHCISWEAYEPNIPITCEKDSATGQRFCELRPGLIKNCYRCWKTKCNENGCKTIKAVA